MQPLYMKPHFLLTTGKLNLVNLHLKSNEFFISVIQWKLDIKRSDITKYLI